MIITAEDVAKVEKEGTADQGQGLDLRPTRDQKEEKTAPAETETTTEVPTGIEAEAQEDTGTN